jgi:uncharacterized membrane protein
MLPVGQLHPIAVHFPIVFFLTLAALDAVLLLRGAPVSGRSCAANVSVGLSVLAGLSAIATYVLGDMAYDVAAAAGVPAATLETHESIGTWTAVFIIAWMLLRGVAWWREWPLDGGRKLGLVAVEIAGSLLIIVAAYFGGQLVYELGVNVSRAAGG